MQGYKTRKTATKAMNRMMKGIDYREMEMSVIHAGEIIPKAPFDGYCIKRTYYPLYGGVTLVTDYVIKDMVIYEFSHNMQQWCRR